MPAKLIPDQEVSALLDAGWSLVRISEWLRKERGISVSPDAISIWRRRRGMPRIRPSSAVEIIPWKIEPQHRFKHALVMLRAESRVRRGGVLPATVAADHRNWRKRVREQNLVVEYRPDTAEGFFYVPKRPGEDVTRMPKVVTALQKAVDRED